MSCPCNILISYSYSQGDDTFTYTDVELISAGILNGKSYYTFTTNGNNYTIIWTTNLRWEIIVDYEELFPIVLAVLAEDLDCPGTPETSSWEIDPKISSVFYFNTTASCQLTTEQLDALAEAQECFNIVVWDLQCKYAQCVLKYFTNLKFGIDNKIEFESLMKKKRALGILQCYDSSDILLDTTLYNNITYSEIKQLMSKF